MVSAFPAGPDHMDITSLWLGNSPDWPMNPDTAAPHRQRAPGGRHQMIGRDGRQASEIHQAQALSQLLSPANPANTPGAA
jgi:hypothetical protein